MTCSLSSSEDLTVLGRVIEGEMGDVASEGLVFPQGRQKKQAEGRWYMHPHTVLVCVSVWLLIFQAVLF